MYPLLDLTGPSSHVYACDFAPTAVELVCQHPQFASGRVTAFTADITRPNVFETHVPPASVDACMMVFVLSAISPLKMRLALENVRSALKDGGVVCFRDYASGDLCEKRMRGDIGDEDGGDGASSSPRDGIKRQRKLGPGFFVRGDSTRCYYFTSNVLDGLFAQAGFVPVDAATVVEKHELNRKTEEARVRRYVQGVYRKEAGGVTRVRTDALEDPFAGYPHGEDQTAVDVEDVDSAQHVQVGSCWVCIPAVRPADLRLAEDLCAATVSSMLSTSATTVVEVAGATSAGLLSIAALQAAETRRVICCCRDRCVRSRMKRIFGANSSRFLWERLRIGGPDDVVQAQLIVLQWWRGADGVAALGIAAALAIRTGGTIVAACSQEDLADLEARAKECNLTLLAVPDGPAVMRAGP